MLKKRSLDSWIVETTLKFKGEHVAAIDCKRDAAIVSLVTNKRLLDIFGPSVHSIKLSQ